MREMIKRTCISFSISSFAGLFVNFLIDIIVNATGTIDNFVSIPPSFAMRFATPAMAAYANVLLYGAIGATFASMSFIFEISKLGFLLQYMIYFCSTGFILAIITTVLWELQNIPIAFVSTLIGYGFSFLIMGIVQYRMAKQDINKINEMIFVEDSFKQ